VSNAIELIPNKLAIEQVSASPFWRMRVKVNGRWKSKTTKEREQRDAEAFARQQYAEMQLLEKHGIYTNAAVTVSDVSKLYYQQLIDAQANGSGKPTYESYKSVITRYIDPIAGKWDIRAISKSKLDSYFAECEQIIGRRQAKGTINTHNVVWRQIFRIAQDRRWVTANEIPHLTVKDKGRESQKWSAFTLDEYKQFRRFLRTYHETSDRFSSEYRRKLLREYCIFLFATGMRPGKEVLGLRWKHIQLKDGATPVTIINPLGKTGDRPIVAMNFIKPALRRLKRLTGKTELEDFVFATPDGKAAKGMSHLVSRALTDAGLRFDNLGRKRAAYSFRHTYATLLRIYRDFSFDELAENMGNSVEMIQRHYNQAKTTDRATRYATGRSRRSHVDRRVDQIYDIIRRKYDDATSDFLVGEFQRREFDDEELMLKAFDIEIQRWNEQAENKDETATGTNLKYIFEAAYNRVDEFLTGETIW
jgi:integrase